MHRIYLTQEGFFDRFNKKESLSSKLSTIFILFDEAIHSKLHGLDNWEDTLKRLKLFEQDYENTFDEIAIEHGIRSSEECLDLLNKEVLDDNTFNKLLNKELKELKLILRKS